MLLKAVKQAKKIIVFMICQRQQRRVDIGFGAVQENQLCFTCGLLLLIQSLTINLILKFYT